jgi:hypothetical protein
MTWAAIDNKAVQLGIVFVVAYAGSALPQVAPTPMRDTGQRQRTPGDVGPGPIEPLINVVILQNTSPLDATIKLIGPSGQTLTVRAGHYGSRRVTAGEYAILVRYGASPAEYIYSQSGPFQVTQTGDEHSSVKITLPKVPKHDVDAQRQFERRQQWEDGREARIANLRSRLGLDPKPEEQANLNLTLEDARKQLVLLKRTVRDIQGNLTAEYAAERQDPNTNKGIIETSSEYETRVARERAQRASVDREYANDLAALTDPYRRQISELLSKKYLPPRKEWLKMKVTTYDADRQMLFATYQGRAYGFLVAREMAQLLYDNPGRLTLKANFLQAEEEKQAEPNEVVLVDLASQTTFKSIWVGVYNISGLWKAKTTGPTAATWRYRGHRGYCHIQFDLKVSGDKLTGAFQERCREGVASGPIYGTIDGDDISIVAEETSIVHNQRADRKGHPPRNSPGIEKRSFKGKAFFDRIDFAGNGGSPAFTAKKEH